MPRMALTSFTAAIISCPHCATPNLYWNRSNGMTNNRGWPIYLKYTGDYAKYDCFACKRIFNVRSNGSLTRAR